MTVTCISYVSTFIREKNRASRINGQLLMQAEESISRRIGHEHCDTAAAADVQFNRKSFEMKSTTSRDAFHCRNDMLSSRLWSTVMRYKGSN